MGAQYSAVSQRIPAGADVVFTLAPVPCNRGLIFHRAGSGIFRLASPIVMGFPRRWRRCCCAGVTTANYPVSFHGSFALPDGGTPGQLSLAIFVDTEEDQATQMFIQAATPGEFQTVGAAAIVQVPSICPCSSVAVRNTSDQDIELNGATLLIGAPDVR